MHILVFFACATMSMCFQNLLRSILFVSVDLTEERLLLSLHRLFESLCFDMNSDISIASTDDLLCGRATPVLLISRCSLKLRHEPVLSLFETRFRLMNQTFCRQIIGRDVFCLKIAFTHLATLTIVEIISRYPLQQPYG